MLSNQRSTIPRPDLTDSTRGVEPVRLVAVQQRKLARAREIAEQLHSMPFVRLVAVGNSVAMGTAMELSDIDLFVVTAPGRLWTARFSLVLRAKWLGLTKRPGKTADQADFGFWVDETALDLGVIALRNDPPRITSRGSEQSHPRDVIVRRAGRLDDPYLSRWVATLIPLVDRGGVYQRLIAANWELLQKRRSSPVSFTSEESSLRSATLQVSPTVLESVLGSWFGGSVEWLLFRLQRWKVWREPVAQRADPLTANGQRIDVVTTRTMCKLHHLDQRAKLREQSRAALDRLEK